MSLEGLNSSCLEKKMSKLVMLFEERVNIGEGYSYSENDVQFDQEFDCDGDN
jgi:hypothetical protein